MHNLNTLLINNISKIYKHLSLITGHIIIIINDIYNYFFQLPVFKQIIINISKSNRQTSTIKNNHWRDLYLGKDGKLHPQNGMYTSLYNCLVNN